LDLNTNQKLTEMENMKYGTPNKAEIKGHQLRLIEFDKNSE